MLASATSIRSVSESIPLRFFALVTSAFGILPRTTWVRSPRSSPSFSAMTITSRNLLERTAPPSSMTACFLLRAELDWTPRFTTHPPRKTARITIFGVAQYQYNCSTQLRDSLERRARDLQSQTPEYWPNVFLVLFPWSC